MIAKYIVQEGDKVELESLWKWNGNFWLIWKEKVDYLQRSPVCSRKFLLIRACHLHFQRFNRNFWLAGKHLIFCFRNEKKIILLDLFLQRNGRSAKNAITEKGGCS